MKHLPPHPLQSKAWVKFREKIGTTMCKVDTHFYISIHPIPFTPFTIGYAPKCREITKKDIPKLIEIGRSYNAVFIKLEPNTLKKNSPLAIPPLISSPHPLFTKYTFHIDLTKSKETLLKQMKPKTRYNIKVAKRHGVIVKEQSSKKAFETYLSLSRETWKRKGFKAHSETYHRTMWEVMHKEGIAYLLTAEYKKITLAAWILFLYKNVLYYPYGASSSKHKNVMASTLLMWEAICWGIKHNATLFDLWGALGPNPNPAHPWYGFHRFKQGFGAELVELSGSYDLILKPSWYRLYNIIHPLRQKLMGLS